MSCRIGVVGNECGLTVLVLVNAQLYDVFRFESAAVINVLINILSPKLNNQIF